MAFNTTTPENFTVDHNTIIRDRDKDSEVFTNFWYRQDGPDPQDSWMTVSNNIINLPNGGKVFYDTLQWPHHNNVISGDLNDDLGSGDIQADPDLDDGYALSPASPARGAGTESTADTDFYGTTSDIGAVVFTGTTQTI